MVLTNHRLLFFYWIFKGLIISVNNFLNFDQFTHLLTRINQNHFPNVFLAISFQKIGPYSQIIMPLPFCIPTTPGNYKIIHNRYDFTQHSPTNRYRCANFNDVLDKYETKCAAYIELYSNNRIAILYNGHHPKCIPKKVLTRILKKNKFAFNLFQKKWPSHSKWLRRRGVLAGFAQPLANSFPSPEQHFHSFRHPLPLIQNRRILFSHPKFEPKKWPKNCQEVF